MELEKRVGSRLFDRSNGVVSPTEMGLLFLRHAESLLGKAADMNRALREAGGQQEGEIVVGAGIYPTETILGPALGSLSRNHPGLRVRVVHDHVRDLVRLLQKREIDLLVCDAFWMQGRDDMVAVQLNAHQGCFAVRAGHPLLAKKNLTLAHVIAQPLVCASMTIPRIAALATRVMGDSSMADQLAHWIPSIITESLSTMCATAASSEAVTVLPLKTALEEAQRGRLAVLPLEMPWLKIAVSVMRLAHHPLSGAGHQFLEAVKQADADFFAESEKAVATAAQDDQPKRSKARSKSARRH
jgi:DNA-binding transcriptional LysR family regulator